jgi:hypothetical protein
MTSLDLVTWDANSPNLYAYTTSGIQLISPQQTQTVYPEITDFVSGRYFEDFDDTLNQFTTTVINTAMQKKIEMVADRYFIVSYGINELTHAIVFDLSLKRYGKLKITHVEAFTYKIAATGILEIPRQSLGFLKKDGSVSVVDFSIGSPALSGTMILGKYQYVRSRLMQLDEIELESIRPTQTFSLAILTSYEGKQIDLVTTPYLANSGGLNRTYTCRVTGTNHSLLLKGGFMCDSIVLTFNIHGKR